jgi:hypothetical protein
MNDYVKKQVKSQDLWLQSPALSIPFISWSTGNENHRFSEPSCAS